MEAPDPYPETPVDLDRYPLNRPEGAAYRQLVEQVRADLAAHGMFTLPAFLRPEIAAREGPPLAARAMAEGYTHARRHNIYFAPPPPKLANHPAYAEMETINHTLTYDQLQGGPVAALYRWPPLARFLAAAMGKPALYPMEDPLAAVNVMAYRDGEALNWHFDRSEFTTTLLLQAPDAGGAFEYRPDLRTEDDANLDGVARLMAGDADGVETLDLTPGALNVFKGRNTAHRVTPVGGPQARVIAVFSYFDRPGVVFTPQERIGFYGRAG